MKKLLILLLIVINTTNTNATILTVDNSPNTPAIYQNLLDAINAANPDDTIYVQGSSTSYPAVSVNKRLVIIGPGHRPNKQAPLVVNYGGGPAMSFNAGAEGSTVMGMNLAGGLWFSIDSIHVAYNKIGGSLVMDGNNLVVENNVIGTINGGSGKANVILRNNIITGTISGFSEPSVEISNNIFLINSQLFNNISNVVFKNNIVFKSDPAGASGVSFQNNITYQVSTTIPYGTNTGIGNFNNTDPEFVNVPAGSNSFNYSHDYHLQNTSPGINAGTDGTNIGVYGGLLPFKMGGEPPIPLIKEFNIWNSVVPVGGNLDINIVGESQ